MADHDTVHAAAVAGGVAIMTIIFAMQRAGVLPDGFTALVVDEADRAAKLLKTFGETDDVVASRIAALVRATLQVEPIEKPN